MPTDICRFAAMYNNVKCLQFLVGEGYTCDESAFEAAVYNGHIATIKYLHGIGCPYDANILAATIYHNQLECMIYLHEQMHLPWTIETYMASVGRPQCLPFLKYIVSHGGPIDNLYICAQPYHIPCILSYLEDCLKNNPKSFDQLMDT
jgi:hypothetical protein